MLQDIEKIKVQYLMSLLFDLFEILQAVRSERISLDFKFLCYGNSKENKASLDITSLLPRPYDFRVLLYYAILLSEIGLFIGLSFHLRFSFGFFIFQPETACHNSDYRFFKPISSAITAELLVLLPYCTQI